MRIDVPYKHEQDDVITGVFGPSFSSLQLLSFISSAVKISYRDLPHLCGETIEMQLELWSL